MRVEAKRKTSLSPIIAARTESSLNYALSSLRQSELFPYIQQVYLYGSCARNEQTYSSDVDLFVVLADDIDTSKYKSAIFDVKGAISPVVSDLPEVDMHITIGNDWEADNMLYYKNIRREGIKLWDKHHIPI